MRLIELTSIAVYWTVYFLLFFWKCLLSISGSVFYLFTSISFTFDFNLSVGMIIIFQLIVLDENETSFIQTRGSVPVFWEQPGVQVSNLFHLFVICILKINQR